MSPCPRCATPTAPDAWFCGRCGLDLVTARGAAQASAAATGGAWPPAGPGTTAAPWVPGAPVPLGPSGPAAAATMPAGPAPAWGAAPAAAAAMPYASPSPAPAWATVLPPPGPAGAWLPPSLPAQPPGHTAGRITMALLALSAVLSGVLILLTLPLLEAGAWYGDIDADAIDGASSLGSLVGLLVAVAYLCWSHQVTAGFNLLSGLRPRVGRIAVIGWWFVPLANLVMPPVAVSGLSTGLAVPGRRRAAWPIVVWWIAFLLSRILQTLWGIRLNGLVTDAASDAADFAASTTLLIAGEAFSILAAIALIAIIRGIAADSAARLAARSAPSGWAGAAQR